MVKVSVVVPVYNPGPFIEPGIASMLGQTLPPDELEIIYVDDGSTDDSPARLDALAAEHPNVRVIHTPNSGWAGRPRNIGIREARGEYVQLLDQDDSMAPDALRLLYEMGRRNRSDIVIGKVASDFRPVPLHLFRQNREVCNVHDTSLISSLTPHKMFRTAFLREHGIEFPEGRRRLEDQLFMVRAYLAARTVSILADTVCYFYNRRADGRNAGAERPAPAAYFGNLREILEVIVAGTEPGPFRASLLARFCKTSILDRLSEPYYLARDQAYRDELFTVVRTLDADFMDDLVRDGLGTIRRLRLDLLRADRPDLLLALAERLSGLHAIATMRSMRWIDEALEMRYEANLALGPEHIPFGVVRRERDVLLDPNLTDTILDGPVPVHEPSPWLRVETILRNPAAGTEWQVPSKRKVSITEDPDAAGGVRLTPRLSVVATLDASSLAAGRPLGDGRWELWTRVFGPGIDRRVRVTAGSSARVAPAGIVPRDRAATYAAFIEARGRVVLQVERSIDKELRITIPALGTTVAAASQTEVIARSRRSVRRLPATLEPASDGAVLVARAVADTLAPGSWRLAARLDGSRGRELRVGTLEVFDPRGARPSGGRRRGLRSRLLMPIIGRVRPRQRLQSAFRRLPVRLRQRIEQAVRSSR
jgi:glycosyltransferase involved in cell wall biosynthesis